MEPYYTHTSVIGPAPKGLGDSGNPWFHRWHYSDGSYRDVVVGRFKKYAPVRQAFPSVTAGDGAER